MKKILSLIGLSVDEPVKVLSPEERLAIISDKANDAYNFGPTIEEPAEFRIGTDGYEVEEIDENQLEAMLKESEKNALIDRLIDNPELRAEAEKIDAPQLVCSTWGHINPKGRRDGGG